MTVDDMISDTIAREGGFVNDPADKGGATNFGVTIGTLRRLGFDVNNDGKINEIDVRRLTKAQAAAIYKDQYFHKPKISALPPEIQPVVFDTFVNSGSHAIKILQRVLNEFGEKHIVADGTIGPMTISAAQRVQDRAGDYLRNAYAIERRKFFFNIADKSPSQRKFAMTRNGKKGGWIARAEEFMDAKYHLTDVQFKKRVSRWA